MDSLSQLLTNLNNARLAGKKRVAVPHSRLALSMAQFLQTKGYLAKIREQEGTHKKLILTLAYEDGAAKLHGVRRLSTPGQRRYAGSTDIPYVYDGLGLVVVSTSRGLLDDRTARKEGVGGELLCEIW